MTTKTVADWLAATVTSDMGITCAKGFPAWDRAATTTSAAFIEWRSDEPEYGTRISAGQDKYTTTFQMLFLAANEVALWTLIDSAKAMTKSRTEASIGGTRYKLQWGAFARAEPSDDTTTEAMRYAAVANVSIRL